MSPPEPDSHDAEFDAMLHAHFDAALLPQAGRALSAFGEHLARQRQRRIVRLCSTAALAAGLLIAWGLASSWFTGGSASPPSPAPVTVAQQSPLEVPITQSASWSRVMDDGLGLVNQQPVRQFRRNVVEEVNWYDPSTKARVRQTTPRQEIFLIGVQTD